MPRVEEARDAALGQRAALAAGGEGGQREPALLQRLGHRADVLGLGGLVHGALGAVVGVQRPGVVGALGVVRAGGAGVEVEAVEFLAEGGDVLVHHGAQLGEFGAGLGLLALLGTAEQQEHTGARQRHQRHRNDDPGGGGAVLRALALGLLDGLVDEVVDGAVDVAGVRTGRRAGDVPGLGDRQRLGVGADVELVAAPHAVDADDADLGAQVVQQRLGRVRLAVRQHRDEDRLVGLLQLLRQGVGLVLGEPAGHRRVDVHLGVLQRVGRVVQPGRLRGRGQSEDHQQAEQSRQHGGRPGGSGAAKHSSHTKTVPGGIRDPRPTAGRSDPDVAPYPGTSRAVRTPADRPELGPGPPRRAGEQA